MKQEFSTDTNLIRKTTEAKTVFNNTAEIKCDVTILTYLQLQLYCHNITACNDQSYICTSLNSLIRVLYMVQL